MGVSFFDIKNIADKKEIPCIEINPLTFDKKISILNHQGVVAYVQSFDYVAVDDILAIAAERKQSPFLLLLDGIKDPHNLGAIIRSADAAGVHGVVIPKHHSAHVNETIYKTSAGAINWVAIAQVTNLVNTIEALKTKNIWVYGADQKGIDIYNTVKLNTPLALVVGDEGKGLRRLVGERCDQLIKIPMQGKIQSLNVSVATAILLYEVVRQNGL